MAATRVDKIPDDSAPAREEKTSTMLWDGWASLRLGLHTLSCVAFHLLSIPDYDRPWLQEVPF